MRVKILFNLYYPERRPPKSIKKLPHFILYTKPIYRNAAENII